jgi:hypothetical protein
LAFIPHFSKKCTFDFHAFSSQRGRIDISFLIKSVSSQKVFLPSVSAHSPLIHLKSVPKETPSSTQHVELTVPRGGNSIQTSDRSRLKRYYPLNARDVIVSKDTRHAEVSTASLHGGKAMINSDNVGWWISLALSTLYLILFTIPHNKRQDALLPGSQDGLRNSHIWAWKRSLIFSSLALLYPNLIGKPYKRNLFGNVCAWCTSPLRGFNRMRCRPIHRFIWSDLRLILHSFYFQFITNTSKFLDFLIIRAINE